jgi:hypothetical protein
MKRLVTILLILLLPTPAHAGWRRDEIRYQSLRQKRWAHTEVVRTIRAAVHHWPVPGGVSKALAVGTCESGLRYNANNGGDYLGVWQMAAGYWYGRVNAFDSRRWDLAPSPFNARSSTIVAIRMVHSGGWDPWACA